MSRNICRSKVGAKSEIIAIFSNPSADILTNADEYGPTGAVTCQRKKNIQEKGERGERLTKRQTKRDREISREGERLKEGGGRT